MIKLDDILKVKGDLINREVLKAAAFKKVCIDSREVQKGDIFIAIKGDTNDGHNYIAEVIKKKPGIIIASRKWHRENGRKFNGCAFYVVKETVSALGELAYYHRKRMNIPILCVAGSNGKTTTKDIVSNVLSCKFNVIRTAGNHNNHIGLPLTLLRISEKNTFCVAEIGSNHFGELNYLCKIAEPDFALVTNIGKEHLEFFKSIKGVAKEEFTAYDYIRKNGSLCFFNLDDEYIRNYTNLYECNSFTYSYKYKADVKGINQSYDKKFRPVIEYIYNRNKYKVCINTFGKHSFYNGLAAVAVGLYFGIKPKDISGVLSNISEISSKRMEMKEYSGIKVINDAYNSNPNSVKLGLETINDFTTKGKKHIILSDMLEMGKGSEKEHFEIGKMIKTMKFDFVYTYGPLSYHVFKGAKGYTNNFYFKDKEDLTAFVRLNIKKGDITYFKGSRGMKIEEVINNLFK